MISEAIASHRIQLFENSEHCSVENRCSVSTFGSSLESVSESGSHGRLARVVPNALSWSAAIGLRGEPIHL